ncbi:MAG TPA: hypothetical protein VFU15_00510 [Bacteroidia bacterium]|nr:hypothetical protein [Bacteroidia bacterium]
MIIVFGIRKFSIYTFSPSELGFTDPSWNGIQFKVLQQYFHLMWIPFFPVGKKWAISKPDGKLYEVPHNILGHLGDPSAKVRTPWYAFAGLILAGVAGIISGISNMM